MYLTHTLVEELLELLDTLPCTSGDKGDIEVGLLRHPSLLQFFQGDIFPGAWREIILLLLLKGKGIYFVKCQDARLLFVSQDFTEGLIHDTDLILKIVMEISPWKATLPSKGIFFYGGGGKTDLCEEDFMYFYLCFLVFLLPLSGN